MAHEHGHDHHSHTANTGQAGAEQGLDLAGQSLGDALRWSFRILSVFIVLLVLFFFVRGTFSVPPDQKVLVSVFGKVDASSVRDEGVHFAWPSPINDVARISINSRTFTVGTFWPRTTERDRMDAAEQAEQGEEVEKPVLDAEGAYMLTGELNIVEGIWDVTYNVKSDSESLVKYYTKVALDEKYAFGDPRRDLQEEMLIKVLLQAAVVREISGLSISDIYPRNDALNLPIRIKNALDEALKELDCGIVVTGVNLKELRPPKDVLKAFDDVLKAHQQAEADRIQAEQTRKKILTGAAGDAGLDLGNAINEWWEAREKRPEGEKEATPEMIKKEEEIELLFASAGGTVKDVLAKATAYRKNIAEETKGDVGYFNSIAAESPQAIKIFMETRRVDVMREVLENCFEVFMFRPMENSKGELEILMNRRPELLRQQSRVPEQY